jgi:hypothetical protein
MNTLRDGRFVVLGLLGEGSQGRTFDGVDKKEGRAVAIKRFDVRGARSWKDVELAEREASVLQSLSHPMLPKYVDRFEEEGALYLVMEKIEGESLASLKARGQTLSEGEIDRLLHDASEVLDYLHGRSPPVIHRDLKPGNVIRRPDGSFAFVDFGAVRAKLAPKGGSTVVGTFGYMAPEQFQGRALPASDIYAIGATAISMLTGSEPEDLPHQGLAIDVHAALRGRATERTIALLERMVAPNPDDRATRIAEASVGDQGSRAPYFGWPGAPPPWGAAPPWEEAWRTAARGWRSGSEGAPSWREQVRDARRMGRALRRDARREARRAVRSQWQPPGGPHRVRFPLSAVFALVFAVGMLAVAIATQLVVPLVLRVLSIFFAREELTEAASNVRRAGKVALESMSQYRRWVGGRPPRAESPGAAEPQGAPPVRVAATEEPSLRVELPEDERPQAQEDESPEAQEDESPEAHAAESVLGAGKR